MGNIWCLCVIKTMKWLFSYDLIVKIFNLKEWFFSILGEERETKKLTYENDLEWE